MITELTALEVELAFLPMITFSPPVLPDAPALYPIITLSSADVIVLYAPTPIITFCVAVDNVPVVVSPILILLLKLVPENFTSLKLSNPPEKAKSIVSDAAVVEIVNPFVSVNVSKSAMVSATTSVCPAILIVLNACLAPP